MTEQNKTIKDTEVLTDAPKYNDEPSGLPQTSKLEGSQVDYTMLPIIKKMQFEIQTSADYYPVASPYWLPYVIQHGLKKRCYVMGRYREKGSTTWTNIQNLYTLNMLVGLRYGCLVTKITEMNIEFYLFTYPSMPSSFPVVEMELYFIDLTL